MKARFTKPLLLLLVAVALGAASFFQRQLNRLRADPDLGLTRAAPLDPDKAPPLLAFTTVALGSFRGLIANALWLRANDLQEQGKYFEMVQLADWITKLEPTFVQVWLVQAWNMTYNISVKFTDPADRWEWVQRGIELLRDQGLRYNPHEPMVYRELAWFFQHKMGQNLDDAHRYYKTQWARAMTNLFGGDRPNYDELLDPRTDAARQRLDRLRNEYKMDPRHMQQVDQTYGPLEWRLPEAHAIYWASVGLEKAAGKDLIFVRRAIYQSLQLSVFRGRVVRLPADGLIETGPDLDKVKVASDGYEKMMAEEPDKKEVMQRAHRNFLREVVYLLYLQGRAAEADVWLKYLRSQYPEGVPPGLTAREYTFEMLLGNLSSLSFDKTKAVIEGLLVRAYRSLAIDDDEIANGMLGLARQIWVYYTDETGSQAHRLGLPPLAQMQQEAVDLLVAPDSPLAPELKARLRTRLNLPAPAAPAAGTNAPPAGA